MNGNPIYSRNMDLIELDKLHKDLRKYKFFYYERSESLISDYDFDMMEKKYTEGCDRLGIKAEYRLDSYVGFSIYMPMSLLSFYQIESKQDEGVDVMEEPDEKGQLSLF